MTTRKTTHNADPTMTDLLKLLVDRAADSLHLTVGVAPALRIGGKREVTEAMPLTVEQIRKLVLTVLPPPKQQELDETTFTTSTFGVKGLAKFTLTAYFQRGAPAAVIKRIPFEVPEAPKWLEPAFDWLQPGAFVVVAGKAGSGRSSAVAALVNRINTTKNWHVLTLEDPIAYLFPNRESVIEQLDLEGPMPIEAAVQVARTSCPDVVVVALDDELRTASEVTGAGALTIASLTINDAKSAADVIRKVLTPSQLAHVPGIVWLTRPGEGRLVQLSEL
ncbi:MAG: hypothetical protein DI536_19310 [Archangium gephyra]|uniref:Bacterial type II secretion system protein E domain-containing protein n=1 Tax=Archangium gephyra TaxID=48 RepID=A0A2W5TCE1_9BACT|nr:MAG: hypothetical protein DI536_19310 [Archangium gephyra]